MIDARGQSCPIPVLMVQREMKEHDPDELQVQVDSKTFVEKVTRFADIQGYDVAMTEDGGEYMLTLKRRHLRP